MIRLANYFDKIANFISGFWQIAITRQTMYEYVIEDIELQERNKCLGSIIYYRAIGSRNIQYSSASELNESDVFAKFMPIQAQTIVTLATIETMMQMEITSLTSHYRSYIKKCAKIFRSHRGK